MKWVTRKNANVDRVACPWLIRTTAFDALRQRLAVSLPGTCRAAIYQEG